jgi:hypothetical protein
MTPLVCTTPFTNHFAIEKSLVVRHGRRDVFVPIQHRPLGFEFGFAIIPRASAAPVLLGVKKGGQTGKAKQNKKQPAKEGFHAMRFTRLPNTRQLR